MTNNKIDKYSVGFGLSLAITSILNTIILLVKETSASVMNAMKAATGHHWITHGMIVIILFVLLGFVFSNMKIETKWDSQRMLRYIVLATIISGVVIAGFYLPGLKVAGVGIKY
jgi:uncharacterized membrane protein SirB2